MVSLSYKHSLLDYFLYVLHENNRSDYLHQEIAYIKPIWLGENNLWKFHRFLPATR